MKMNAKENGGSPAHPAQSMFYPGMTKRELLAMNAPHNELGSENWNPGALAQDYAKARYAWADAMLEAGITP